MDTSLISKEIIENDSQIANIEKEDGHQAYDQTNDVIEKDDQTAEIDKSDDINRAHTNSHPAYDPTKSDIDIREEKVSIYEYMRRYDKGLLKIDPDYQRNLVWKPRQKCRFIESIALNFPLPPVYLNQQISGKFVIIDGLQRTTTLHQFINNKFQLQDLETLPNLNGFYFKDLPDVYQSKIEDKQLQLYILKPSVPIAVVYELFDRINTGGTPLNRQEVRNCIFEGVSTKLLKELATDERYGFRKAIDGGVSSTRMKDREVVLRYLSFKLFDPEQDYKGDLSELVERAMDKINNLNTEAIEDIKSDFKRVMDWSYLLFGNKNFRFPIYNNNTGHYQSRGFINTSMFETVCSFISRHSDDFLKKNVERIRENYEKLLKTSDYMDSVRFATGSKFRVINRFRLAHEILSYETSY